ncbi:hypothetical protein BGK67_33535 [Streptomyces subrutilus]|uniref:Uncharacterized protein n=1 Tax=Streptomyces subrutilus TaxID=36818 RepID=A0A1E5P062_9ACTN|nr:hypothetical protein BGK67_33535 [Streptomyces subrutilus]
MATPVPAADAAGKAVTQTGGTRVTVTMPSSADGLIEAKSDSGDTVRIGLKGAAKGVSPVTSGTGTVVYQNVAAATDLSVQATSDGGVRTLVTLKDRSASTEHRFPLELQAGVTLIDDGAGGYLMARDSSDGFGETIGALEAPWAKDAAGRPVPTSYRLEGNTLVQTVQTSSDTTFPVVADPKITYGAGIYFNATGAEWTSYGIAAGSVGYFANVAGCAFTDKIPNVGLKRAATAICSAVGYKTLKDWGAFLENEINNSSLNSWACYQTKLAPRNGRLTEVSAGNCK